MTAGCIWLGLKTERVRKQRQTVFLVKSFGGETAYDYQYAQSPYQTGGPNPPPGPKLLRALLGDDYFADLVSVEIKNVSDIDVQRIAAQTTLRHLSVAGGCSDDSLAAISELTDLESLAIDGGRFTAAGFDRLSKLTGLRTLALSNQALSDASVRSIGRLVTLQSLSLQNSRLASKQVCHLTSLRNLSSLDLSGTLVGDEGLDALHELKGLKVIRLDGSMATAKGIDKLQAALPNAQVSSMVVGRGFF